MYKIYYKIILIYLLFNVHMNYIYILNNIISHIVMDIIFIEYNILEYYIKK